MTNDAAAPAISVPGEFLAKPVDFDALKAQLRQLPST
jgi:hypothetical protein